ncbi:MAG: endo-1,4-beta-xylanase [Prolixibacteraceae bacterium]|nr:endo-1,4-beta-xylanase [Prolixibacteraceae bacterium]
MINRRKFIRNSALTAAAVPLLNSRVLAAWAEEKGLRDLYKNDFYIGTAINGRTLNNPRNVEILKKDFNSITAENEFKWSEINPSEGEWRFDFPDQFVKFGEENEMYMIGHCLVWHSQVPRTIFSDASGNRISKEGLLKKMEEHIHTLVGRYKGRIQAWDVVNESITPEGYRNSQWYSIMGPEFMEHAFRLAHDADPNAHLMYNDYNMDDPKKRENVVNLVKDYKKKGIPIHGIGMQAHYHLEEPALSIIEDSIKAYSDLGMKVHLTEMDIDVLPSQGARTAEISTNVNYEDALNPYTEGLPKEIDDKLTKRYEELFKLCLKYKDSIERVTTWGISDDMSWKNGFPVRGRTNYPLLFDRNLQPKNAYHAIAALKS